MFPTAATDCTEQSSSGHSKRHGVWTAGGKGRSVSEEDSGVLVLESLKLKVGIRDVLHILPASHLFSICTYHLQLVVTL